jgi:hypothetical protein
MELSVRELNLHLATKPIPDYEDGDDPYLGIQVHDYQYANAWCLSREARTATKATIQVLTDYYPETLRRKIFVKIPKMMRLAFNALRLKDGFPPVEENLVLVSKRKNVTIELGPEIPKEYGGRLDNLQDVGKTLKLE